jgi:hypothetical protein
VTNINGRDISLSSLGDILTISLTNDARIFSFDTPSAQQMVNLENIRIGDNVNISLKPLPDGKLQGSSVIILPVSNPGE